MGKTKYHYIYAEITTPGFVSRNIKDFAKFVKPLGISYERMIGKCRKRPQELHSIFSPVETRNGLIPNF